MKVLILGQNHSSVMDSLCLGLKLNGIDATAFSLDYPLNHFSNYENINIVFNKKRSILQDRKSVV